MWNALKRLTQTRVSLRVSMNAIIWLLKRLIPVILMRAAFLLPIWAVFTRSLDKMPSAGVV
jgi:hypothetical protein